MARVPQLSRTGAWCAAGRLRTTRAKVDDLSSDLGLAPNSRTARALLAGYIDRAEAERIAAICRHRHEETNYDDLLASGMSKEDARALAQ